MTPEAQRIAIAEACGVKWKRSAYRFYYQGSSKWPIHSTGYDTRKEAGEASQHFENDGYTVSPIQEYEVLSHLPAYTEDLNAMHEAEEMLTDEQHEAFRKHLQAIAARGGSLLGDATRRRYVSAPASERAEAFLRARNLWKP